MEAGTRVFSDATQSSPSGCKKLGKHGSRKGAVRQWALQNDEKNQQGGHSIYQRRYAWNEKNLLKESSDGRHTVYYRYGADGQRALKSSGQSETLYFNTMWSWIHNSSAYNTDREIKHIYLGSERLVTRTNGAGSDGHTSTADACTYYYHSDHLGSAHLITDYKGDEYERVEYTPYGEYRIEKSHAAGIMKSLFFTSFAEQNSVSNRKVASFTGKERDEETGLYYYGARYLDPKTSRWLSADPALGEYIPMAPVDDEAKKHNRNLPGMGGIYNTVNMHLYHYAGNNPIKYVDPDGRVIAELAMTRLIIEVGKAETQIIGAIYDFISQYKKMKDENVIGNDHYNHAMANSRATLRGKYGKMTAQILSFVREVTDVLRKGDTDMDIREDNIANRYGREIKPGEKPEEHNAIFDTRQGGQRADLEGIASKATPKTASEFLKSYFTRDVYEK